MQNIKFALLAILIALPGSAFASVNITGATFNGGSTADPVAPGAPVTIAVSYTSTGSNDVESMAANGACEDTLNSSTSGTFTRSFIYSAPVIPGWHDTTIEVFGSDVSILFGLIQVDNNWCVGASRDSQVFPMSINVVEPSSPEPLLTPEEACLAIGNSWNTETHECYRAASGGGPGVSYMPWCDEPLYGKDPVWPNCFEREIPKQNVSARPFPVFITWWDEVERMMKTRIEA